MRRRKERKALEELERNVQATTPNTAFDHVVYFTVDEVANALCRCYPARTKGLKSGQCNVVFSADYVRLRQRESVG